AGARLTAYSRPLRRLVARPSRKPVNRCDVCAGRILALFSRFRTCLDSIGWTKSARRDANHTFVSLKPLFDGRPVPPTEKRFDRWHPVALEHQGERLPFVQPAYAQHLAGDLRLGRIERHVSHDGGSSRGHSSNASITRLGVQPAMMPSRKHFIRVVLVPSHPIAWQNLLACQRSAIRV